MANIEGRVRYCKDWNGKGEYYLFESRRAGEDEYSLENAFKLWDYEGENAVMIHFSALPKIREWMAIGVNFHFE